MGLEPERILKRLGKPLSLAWKIVPDFLKAQAFNSRGEHGDHQYRPEPSTHSVLTAYPLTPALLVLALLLLLLSSTPVQHWAASGGKLPDVVGFCSRIWNGDWNRHADAPKVNESVGVWAKKQFGFYYCQGGVLFGSKPGELMAQGDALLAGYRPSDGQYCTGGKRREASAGSVPFRVRQWFRSATNNLPTADELLERLRKSHPTFPKASEGVGVWASKQFGFYYCQGDVLFGRKPGKLMKQGNALLSGYQPARHQYCTNSRPDEASAGSLSLPPSSRSK